MDDSIPLKQRILSKVQVDKGCWIWMGSNDGRGNAGLYYDGKNHKVSRLVWGIYQGTIPDGLVVCRSCCTPLCINPEHLFLATKKAHAKFQQEKGLLPVENIQRKRQLRQLRLKKWRKANPEKARAHYKVYRALKSGALTRPSGCQDCGKELPLQGHHPDYTKPLFVEWVCQQCHYIRHENERMFGTGKHTTS